jgi:crotonobetainyl-CoA:carnitine CoA-transferase CaiB-like acyl-CoA transferase
MEQPFKDLKVIELASVLAGPSVGMFFAELGAEVIKVENKTTGGDVTRSWKLASEDSNHPFSAYYSSVNWGKESIFLNLKDKTDRELLLSKVKDADVLIVNFKPGDAKKLGLSYEEIKAVNSKIIYGEISGFGDSPRIAYDVVLQAESGFLSMCGEPDGNPVKMPVALIDLLAAHQLKEGILIALYQRLKDQQGAKVSVSLYNAALAALANQATNWIMASHFAQPLGTLHPNIAPYGECLTAKDGKQLVLAVGSDRQFQKLCEVLKLDNLAQDQRFEHNQLRVQNRTELAELLQEKISQFQRDEIVNTLINANIPVGAIRNMREVFDQPQAQARLLQEKKEGKTLKTVMGNAFEIVRNHSNS